MIVKVPNHRFILKGFSQVTGGRSFQFEDIDENNVKTAVSVFADFTLIRAYGIGIQELPLLCLELLTRRADIKKSCNLVLTELEMDQIQSDRKTAKEASAQKRKHFKPVVSENTGIGWRANPINTQKSNY